MSLATLKALERRIELLSQASKKEKDKQFIVLFVEQKDIKAKREELEKESGNFVIFNLG